MNKLFNLQLDAKKQGLERAIAKGDWSRYVYLHERPYRAKAIRHLSLHYSARIGGQKMASLLGSAWTDSENIWQNLAWWKSALITYSEWKDYFMEGSDLERLQRLQFPLTIYRGSHGKGAEKVGLSWTLDKARAVWFANRLRARSEPASLYTMRVEADQVYAFMGGREEEEIIIDPNFYRELRNRPLDFAQREKL